VIVGVVEDVAMAVLLGAAYPDVYKAAESLNAAFLAMNFGGPDPNVQGRRSYEAMGARARPVPTIVFHGTADYTVRPVNADQVVAQAAQTADLASDGRDDGDYSATPDSTARGQVPGGRAYTRTTYDGLVERYSVDGMGHAWSGGSTAGSYTDPPGPDASRLTWRFFAEHPHS
jgi:poly(3-hydroxybutyrate) depolymerase